MAEQPKYGNTRFRDQLAFWIILPSFAGILSISVLMVIYAAPDNREEVARLVFSAVLPLFGTWVGTVLAFYFARDNFEAASESTLRLTGLLNRSSAVAELMIPRSQMVVHTLADGDTDGSGVKLEDLLEKIKVSGKNRIPILDKNDFAHFVLHKSLLDEYALLQEGRALRDKTLHNMLGDTGHPEYKELAGAIGFVSVSANVGEARDKMNAIPRCNDVFVTASGKNEEPVVGWITNAQLSTIN